MPSTNTSFPSPSLTRARLSLPRQDLISVIMIIMFATITIFICSCPKFINSQKYTNSNFHLILNMARWYFTFFRVCKLFVARVLGYMSGNYSCSTIIQILKNMNIQIYIFLLSVMGYMSGNYSCSTIIQILKNMNIQMMGVIGRPLWSAN